MGRPSISTKVCALDAPLIETLMGARQVALARATSADGGLTWSPMNRTTLPNPNGAVDAAAVRRVARRLLEGDLTLAALGPIDGLESLDKIASRLAA